MHPAPDSAIPFRRYPGSLLTIYDMLQHPALILRSPAADTLVDLLTVYEMLLYTAELKLPLGTDYKAAVEGVLAALSLQHCRDTRIGRCGGYAR
jgi:hypothetical protein